MQGSRDRGRQQTHHMQMNMNFYGRVALLCAIALLAIACSALPPIDPADVGLNISVTKSNPQAGLCSGRFVEHLLAHETTGPGGDTVRMFEANGGGVAINDLDGDGDLDVVLANHAGRNSILWNEGALHFRRQAMESGDSRAVNIVDVDGDSQMDIVFSRRVTAPNFWRNQGDGTFALTLLPGVDKPLYAITWADLDGDDDLDLVGGTYDAALLTEFGQEFLFNNTAGVYVYENQSGRFAATRLIDNAQALTLALADINGDGRLDILIGNDFAVLDTVWLRTESGWEAAEELFSTMTHSTMSLATADVDNNGSLEIFATDMKPLDETPETLAAWRPIMESMMSDPHPADDPQVMQNVLQWAAEDGVYRNRSTLSGIQATGWSWSGKFGDLDQDGLVDLYVVNGFMEASTFAQMPNHELVEENQAFRNLGDGRFEAATGWALNSTASGRGMSMADLDGDGDLDIVVNNLRSPAQLFENQLCSGRSLQVDLRRPASQNVYALGARLILHTENGRIYREIGAGSGYLSGDPARVHFGIGDGDTPRALEVHWPDGRRDLLRDISADTRIIVERQD